jgi:xylulose-5-phosphate/fructose-6-phosphate phosphoketolase
MPGEVIDRPNPQPTPSNVSDQILSFSVNVEKKKLPEDAAKGLKAFKRAACYIAAGASIGTG